MMKRPVLHMAERPHSWRETTMTTPSRPSWAHRFGEGAGHTWRWLTRQDRRAVAWLTTQGLSPDAARAVSWGVKLLVLGVLLYAAFWVAVCFMFLLAIAWIAPHVDYGAVEETAEWRDGYAGFGLYSRDGVRIDVHNGEDGD
ncbi:DUF3742 family protein [Burkholderia pseudomallei]|uniref:DUF3742 family protein n=1 Tax=Burkholderia pseudomallei TaxID=28450 RepID=UPI0030EEA2C4